MLHISKHQKKSDACLTMSKDKNNVKIENAGEKTNYLDYYNRLLGFNCNKMKSKIGVELISNKLITEIILAKADMNSVNKVKWSVYVQRPMKMSRIILFLLQIIIHFLLGVFSHQ